MNHYGHFAKRDTSMKVRFQRGEITLNIPEDGCLTPEGWKITPMSYPGVRNLVHVLDVASFPRLLPSFLSHKFGGEEPGNEAMLDVHVPIIPT